MTSTNTNTKRPLRDVFGFLCCPVRPLFVFRPVVFAGGDSLVFLRDDDTGGAAGSAAGLGFGGSIAGATNGGSADADVFGGGNGGASGPACGGSGAGGLASGGIGGNGGGATGATGAWTATGAGLFA